MLADMTGGLFSLTAALLSNHFTGSGAQYIVAENVPGKWKNHVDFDFKRTVFASLVLYLSLTSCRQQCK